MVADPARATVAADPSEARGGGFAALLARLLLGGLFLWLGAAKLSDPVAFLKAVRDYGLAGGDHRVLNAIAALLPWIEVWCGAFLVLGVAVRGHALVLLAFLLVFTGAILHRGAELKEAGNLAWCAVAFDCGCGTGVVNLCRKLAENGIAIALAAFLLVSRARRFALRPALFR